MRDPNSIYGWPHKIVLPFRLDNVKMYGNAPLVKLSYEYTEQAYAFYEDVYEIIDADDGFILKVLWGVFGSLAEDGEYDFLSAKQCKELIPYIDKELETEERPYMIEFYQNFKRLAKIAIIYDTGLGLDW